MKKYGVIKVFGDNVKKLRKAKGLTQRELSFICCKSATFINQIESASTTFSSRSIVMISNALNVPISALFKDSNEKI